MLKNYILTVHKNPNQLKRLIEKLNDNYSFFYIHIDLKVDIHPFKNAINIKNVIFIKERVNCIWADYSQVVATLNLLKNVLNKTKKGRVIFLSGQDYPIKSKLLIENYLNEKSDFEFINFVLNPVTKSSHINKQRIEKYKFNLSDRRGDFILLSPFLNLSKNEIKKIIKLTLKRKLNIFRLLPILSLNRKFILKNHYKGTNWWSFRVDTVEKIYNYYLNNKKYLDNYYKYTLCADEQFFHTILKEIMNTDQNIKILPNLHFIDWSRKNVPLPVTLKKDDYNIILKQPNNKLFARKFDSNIDNDILDMIDKNIT